MGAVRVPGDLDRPEGLARSLEGVELLVSAAQIRYAPALVQACRHAGVRRAVLMSSTRRFSRFRTPDVEAVEAGEASVADSGLAATIIRPSMIYGPGNDRNISFMRDYLRRHRMVPVFGGGNRLVQPVYVDDVVDAVVSASQRDETSGRAYDVAGRDAMPYRAMVDTLCRLVGRRVLRVPVPICVALPVMRGCGVISHSARVAADQIQRMGEDRAYDVSQAMRDLDFAPRRFEAGVREAMQQNGEEIHGTGPRGQAYT
jgi:nucleoside-diphosphate-sugar epimerase